jgi:hypothetical protein
VTAGDLRISDFGFRIGQSAIRTPQSALWIMAGLLVAVPLRAGSAYDELIAPILRARCIECHGEQKQKAKLALHTWDALMRGSDGGPVIVASKPAESLLLQRLRLPIDDEEHMPPKDKPQPAAEEIALLTRWIESGASRSDRVDALKLSPELAAAATQLPAKLAAIAKTEQEPPWELDEAEVAKARAPLAGKVAELQRKFPGALSYESRTSAALHFTAVALGREFGDRELALLAPLGAQLALLDVSGTAVTDKSAEVWVSFPRLRVVRASFTGLGDATVVALQKLPTLQSLTLHATRVSAASVSTFTKFSALRALQVGETAAATAAREAKLPVPATAPEPATP